MASIIFILFITVGVPIVGCAYALYKRRLIPFLLGVLAFVISQLLIRMPLLEYLAAESSSYLMWTVKYPVSFVLFLAFSAGIFEELARWMAMTFFMKQRDSLSGVLFGIGHGGIEAFLIVGLTVLSTMNTNISWLSGLERLIAISLHVGLSLIVLVAVKQQRLFYVLLAIGLHGIINTFAGILPLFFSVSLIELEAVLLILASITLLIAYSLLRKDEKL